LHPHDPFTSWRDVAAAFVTRGIAHAAVARNSGLNASFPGFAHKLFWYEKLREFTTSGATRSCRSPQFGTVKRLTLRRPNG
jgi:hypothetical protein